MLPKGQNSLEPENLLNYEIWLPFRDVSPDKQKKTKGRSAPSILEPREQGSKYEMQSCSFYPEVLLFPTAEGLLSSCMVPAEFCLHIRVHPADCGLRWNAERYVDHKLSWRNLSSPRKWWWVVLQGPKTWDFFIAVSHACSAEHG
mgnify:CR=1 FL=1